MLSSLWSRMKFYFCMREREGDESKVSTNNLRLLYGDKPNQEYYTNTFLWVKLSKEIKKCIYLYIQHSRSTFHASTGRQSKSMGGNWQRTKNVRYIRFLLKIYFLETLSDICAVVFWLIDIYACNMFPLYSS